MGRGALAVQDGVQALPGGALGAGVPGREPGGQAEQAPAGALDDAGALELGGDGVAGLEPAPVDERGELLAVLGGQDGEGLVEGGVAGGGGVEDGQARVLVGAQGEPAGQDQVEQDGPAQPELVVSAVGFEGAGVLGQQQEQFFADQHDFRVGRGPAAGFLRGDEAASAPPRPPDRGPGSLRRSAGRRPAAESPGRPRASPMSPVALLHTVIASEIISLWATR